MKTADFTIVSVPAYIKVECPYCNEDIEINWHEIDAPECWGDQWPDIECPYCENEIELGDYDYD